MSTFGWKRGIARLVTNVASAALGEIGMGSDGRPSAFVGGANAPLSLKSEADAIALGSHGDRVRVLHAVNALRLIPNATSALGAGPGFDVGNAYWISTTAPSGTAQKMVIPLELIVGDRIRHVTIYGRTGSSTGLWTVTLCKRPMTNAARTVLGGPTVSTWGGSAADDSIAFSNVNDTVVAGTNYYVEWDTSGAGTGAGHERRLYGTDLTYDHP
jgi:hypothetical protein